MDDIGVGGAVRLFQVAHGRNPFLVPTLTPRMLKEPEFRRLRAAGEIDLGVCVDYEDIDPEELAADLGAIGVSAERCVLLVDFTDAPLGEDIAAPVAAILDKASAAAPWHRVVYTASAYPSANPSEPGTQVLLPRSEWNTFRTALEECSVAPARLAYGDYGADTGQIVLPKKSGGRPRPHLRYTTSTQTLVVRGPDGGAHAPAMRGVCQAIVNSGQFAGRGYSYADDLIWQYANGVSNGCGDPSHWRELNTAHHIVRVVRDLGGMAETSFPKDAVHEFSEQGSLI